MIHYVYRIDDGKKFYIGARSFRGDPLLDKYMGSGAWCLFSVKHNPVKTILSIHESRQLADRSETALLKDYFGTKGCMNRRITHSGAWRRVKNK